jgi:fused signal recognition particle receptor
MAKNDILSDSLRQTKKGIFAKITKALFSSKIGDDIYEDLLDQMILADVGYETGTYLCDELEKRVKKQHAKTGADAVKILQEIVAENLQADSEMNISTKPSVILVIGVNGVGKTTSIGKLSYFYKNKGKKVLMAAGDTFRAAATRQLEMWADRAGVDIVAKGEGADPAGVIFDAVKKGCESGYDLIICDTAGRLNNKKNLMAELGKIRRVIDKAQPDLAVETLLVLEAVTGQNAISQAKDFAKAANATGVILTKLDGTAKGGSVISIKRSLNIPVRFVGVGEKIGDIMEFNAQDFAAELISPIEEK